MKLFSLVPCEWRAYLSAIREHADRRIMLSFLAIMALGMMEVSGLIILLPMLQTMGIESRGISDSTSGILGQIQQYQTHISFLGLLGIFLGLVIGQTLARTTLARLQARLQANFTTFLRHRLHRALTGADWSVFLQLRSSDVVRAFTGEVNMAAAGLSSLTSLASSIVLATVQITAALIIAPSITITAIIVGGAIVLIVRPFARRVREESRSGQTDRGALAANITDHVGGLKLAKSHGAEDRSAQSFQDISFNLGERQVRVAVLQSRSQAAFRLISGFALCLVLWYAVEQVGIRGAELAVMAVIFMRLVSRMMAIQSATQRMAHVFPAYGATEELRQKWIASAEEPADLNTPALTLEHQLTINRVTYHYPNSERAALSDTSLILTAGRTTALCGHSGAGKSTLADLVLGLIPPTTGQVIVDSTPLEGSAIRAWRQSVAYVPQDVFLLNDTIRENLLWLSPDASEAELWNALENAVADDLVRRLPQGLDTVVGERGVRLSGGERQRIALARALLRKPSLLVLDEATSALDNNNERLIKDAIDRLHGTMTILIIAHRLSTIRHADQIVVLNEGRVAQSGAWAELAANESGPFAEMISTAAI